MQQPIPSRPFLGMTPDLYDLPMDYYADAVFSEPGRCWRMVYDGEGSGRPMHCPEPVVWVGNHRLAGGRQIRVWSCDGHREGVERAAVATAG